MKILLAKFSAVKGNDIAVGKKKNRFFASLNKSLRSAYTNFTSLRSVKLGCTST